MYNTLLSNGRPRARLPWGTVAGVLIGFAIIAVIVFAGWLIGRFGLLGPYADYVLSRLAFFVLSPALLFVTISRADIEHLLVAQLPVVIIASVAMLIAFLLVAFLAWRRRVPEAIVGALASGYQNGANIGIPVSAYVLGDAAASAPVIIWQMLILGPVAVAALDLATGGRVSVRRVLLQPLRNPLLIGSVLGIVVALSGWVPPAPVMAPLELVGGGAVPVMLLTFGMALAGQRVLAPGPYRRDVVYATVLKLVAMPLAAWVVARYAFGLDGHELLVAIVIAALPSANNVFNFAQRYERGVTLARDAVFVTTILAIPVLLVVSWLLAD